MAQRGGNKRYHGHGPRSGRERPPGRGDVRRMGGVARAGGPGVAVAPADMLPLLDPGLHNADRAVLCTFCFVNGVPPSLVLDWSGGCVPIFGDESAQHHFAYVHEALSVGR